MFIDKTVQFEYVFPEPVFEYCVSRELEVALIYLSDGRVPFYEAAVLNVT